MERTRPNILKKGWFVTKGRPGDRTLKQQLMGLDALLKACPNKTVLDIGCAEGLIGIELAKRGAAAVHGIEFVEQHLVVANKLRGDLPCTFELADAQHYVPVRQYHIVIMLAVLHKLKFPEEACMRFANAADEMVVLRLPPEHAPIIVDARSNFRHTDMDGVMRLAGFHLKRAACDGPFGEWVGTYRRS
jgi:SAM-dependent methyltransferase